MIILPPPPTQEDNFSSNWRVWLLKVKEQLSTLSTIAWSIIDFTGSNITSIATREHNDLQSIQGGTTNEYYHLTSGQVNNLHTHSNKTILDNIPSGVTTTITTAKLTTLGTNGSMTFTNGVLTAHTDAT